MNEGRPNERNKQLSIAKKRRKADGNFDCEENLQKHIKIKHQCMKFKCNHCGKYFTQQSNRTRHVKMMHEKKLNWAKYEQPQNCHICGKMISTKSNFIRHMKTIHKGIKPKIEHEFCICDFCGKGFNQSSNFTRHLRLDHTNEANIELYKCVKCNKYFKSIASRKQHNTLSHCVPFFHLKKIQSMAI